MTIRHAEENAPAKLNLRLKIEGRRPDGFHLLSMLNTTVSLADSVTVEQSATDSLVVEGRTDVAPDRFSENLVGRAVAAFRNEFNLRGKYRVVLQKRIPSEAGLGGGSSDAAAALRCMAALHGEELSTWSDDENRRRVQRLALTLGADVPYFLRGGAAHVLGVGEDVAPLAAPQLSLCVWIVKPPLGQATPAVYSALRARECSFTEDPVGRALRRTGILPPAWDTLKTLIENDLEPIVAEINPEVRRALAAFRKSGFPAGMTGSGSALFLMGDDPELNIAVPALCRDQGLGEAFQVSLDTMVRDFPRIAF